MGGPEIKMRRAGSGRKRRDASVRPTTPGARREQERHDAKRAAAKARAEELVSSGMPLALAQAVGQGRLTLNEALETMAQRAEIDRLMRTHELNRAFATQVVLGHADLEAFLKKRRFEQHRAAHLGRSVLEEAHQDGEPRAIALFGQRRVEAVVRGVDVYDVTLAVDGVEETQHKLRFKYVHRPADAKRVKKALSKHAALTEAPREPALRPQDRFTCSDRRLYGMVERATPVEVILLEGEVFLGTIPWFSRFEFGLQVKGGAEVVVFRHALHDLVDPGA